MVVKFVPSVLRCISNRLISISSEAVQDNPTVLFVLSEALKLYTSTGNTNRLSVIAYWVNVLKAEFALIEATLPLPAATSQPPAPVYWETPIPVPAVANTLPSRPFAGALQSRVRVAEPVPAFWAMFQMALYMFWSVVALIGVPFSLAFIVAPVKTYSE